MPKFTTTVRVVLHKDDTRTKEHSPDSEEYETLHAEMHTRGFRRYYTTVKDKKRKLPPGEYRIYQEGDDVDDACNNACGKAKAAATIATSAKRFSLFINCEGMLTGCNLEEISKDPDA